MTELRDPVGVEAVEAVSDLCSAWVENNHVTQRAVSDVRYLARRLDEMNQSYDDAVQEAAWLLAEARWMAEKHPPPIPLRAFPWEDA